MDIYKDENKTMFVHYLNSALLECGGGRYEYLSGQPLRYRERDGREMVVSGKHIIADVSGDTLAAMLIDIGKGLTS